MSFSVFLVLTGKSWPAFSSTKSTAELRLISGQAKIEPPSRPNSYWDEPQFRPYFDESIARNITAQMGRTVHLPCRISQLADRTVRF